MSHFSVLVALPPCPADQSLTDYVNGVLPDLMEPWSELRDVEPYKNYISKPDPAEYWSVDGLRSAGSLPAEGPLTWPQVVEAHNTRYAGDDFSETLHYDADDDKPAYTLSTYNPDSKWDYWLVGGRWHAAFTPANGTDPADVLMPADRYVRMAAQEGITRSGVDGGVKRALDLQLMRESASLKAQNEHRRVMTRLADEDLSAYRTWSEIFEAHPGNVDKARQEYFEQPVRKAMKELFPDHFFTPDAEDYFRVTEDQYGAQAAAAEVPGYAFIDLERQWHEPGSMGWFGASTDTPESRAKYHAHVNAAVDQLPDDHVLVMLDCHI